MESISVKRLHPKATLPARAHSGDAGLDITLVEDMEIPPGGGVLASTGIAVAIAPGFAGMIADRSSLAKKGLKTAGGIIDAGYRGEIKVVLWNISQQTHRLTAGDRVAQLLLLPVALASAKEVQELETTHRGSDGFGSTGN